MTKPLLLLSTITLVFGLGCGDGTGFSGEDGGVPFVPEAFGEWLKFEPEGAVCANGSQYKYFVNFSETSDNVLVIFESGGACWDSKSCLQASGIRGATNTECVRNDVADDDCLRDDYASAFLNFEVPAALAEQAAELGIVDGKVPVDFIYPLLSPDEGISPMADWNKVFVPYCTGDVHTGNRVVTYTDTEGDLGDVTFYHNGHNNTLAVIEELDTMFAEVPKLTVGGCSAGGTGAISNYYFIRSGMSGVEKGYLLDDAGPVFPSAGNSRFLHEEIRDVWGVNSVLAKLPEDQGISLDQDFGKMSELLASEFPSDRLAITYFQLDYNYSLYSYERFWTLDGEDIVPFDGDGLGLFQNQAADRAAVHSLWFEDTAALVDQYDGVDNLGYYLPFYRETNGAHCASIPAFGEFSPPGTPFDEAAAAYFISILGDRSAVWRGTEIQSDGLDLREYVDHLLDDDEPLRSYFEEDGEGRFLSCTPVDFDAGLCEAAVNPPG